MYEDVLASAKESGRYKGREKEVAARTVKAHARANPKSILPGQIVSPMFVVRGVGGIVGPTQKGRVIQKSKATKGRVLVDYGGRKKYWQDTGLLKTHGKPRRVPGYYDLGARGSGHKAQRRASRAIFNPSPARVFSEFRGKAVRTQTRGFAANGTPKQLATLGKLKELRLRGRTLKFGGKATLAASGRKRLYVANVRMKERGKRANQGGEVDMGEITGVVYYADKPHIETGSYNYDHDFERPFPHLIVDEEGCPKIEGGGYTITEDGIEH